MNPGKRKRLEASGWKVGGAKEFLGLSPSEHEYVELKLALAKRLEQARKTRKLTQTQLAQRLGSSQSRVAKMEAGDASVSLDLLVRSLLELKAPGASISRMLTAPLARGTRKSA